MEVFRLMGRIVINRGEVSGELKAIEGEAQTLGSRMGATFHKIGDAVHKALIVGGAAASAAIVGMGVAGVKAFSDFEKGMREVFSLLPGLDDLIRDDLTQGVKDLSEELGLLPNEVVPALYEAISTGIPPENVLDFLRVAGKAAIAGVTDLKTTVNGLTTVVNAYGVETMSTTRAADIMFQAVKVGKLTFEELSATLFQAVPIAAQLGVSFEEVSAWAAQLTLQGAPASVAMTQIRAALVALVKDSTPAAQLFEELTGQTFPQFIAGGGKVADAFELIRAHSDKSGISLTALFGRVEGAQAVLGVTGKHLDAFRDKIGQMEESAGSTDGAFEEMEGGLARTFAKLRAWWDVTLIEIGEALEKPVRDFVELLEANKDKIRDLVLNIFDRVKTALFWFIENGRTVAWSIGLITAAFVAIWAATHPLAAAVAAVTVGLGFLVNAATRTIEETNKLNASLSTMNVLWGEATGLLEGLGTIHGLTAEDIARLEERIDKIAGTIGRFVEQGGDVIEAIGRWRNEIVQLLEGYAEAYPEMAEFVDDYIERFDAAVLRELKLRDEQAAAAWAVANQVGKSAEAAIAATDEIAEAYEELKGRIGEVAVALKIAADIEAQRSEFKKLAQAAQEYMDALEKLTWGSEEYVKTAKEAEGSLESLRALAGSLAFQNRDLASSILDVVKRLEDMGVGFDWASRYIPKATTAFGKLAEYLAAWVLQLDDFSFHWKDFVRLMAEGAEELGASIGRAILDMFEDNAAAAERYAADMAASVERYNSQMEAANQRYAEARLSASERFIKQVQREGKTVQEREAMIADAVAKGLLTEEEANAARMRMTDERIKHEGTAIYELEQAVKKAEADKLKATQEAEDAKTKAAEEAAKKRGDAERSVLQILVQVIATALRAAAEELTALAGAQAAIAAIMAATLNWAEAARALGRAAAYAAGAVLLHAAAGVVGSLAQLAEGGLAIRPTVAVVGEGRHEEAVLPLSDEVFRRLGAGIVDAMGKMDYGNMATWPVYNVEERMETVNFEGMFNGAVIHVRDKADVEDLAVEIHRLFTDRQRGLGRPELVR